MQVADLLFNLKIKTNFLLTSRNSSFWRKKLIVFCTYVQRFALCPVEHLKRGGWGVRLEFSADEHALLMNDMIPSSVHACMCCNRVGHPTSAEKQITQNTCLQTQHRPEAKCRTACSSLSLVSQLHLWPHVTFSRTGFETAHHVAWSHKTKLVMATQWVYWGGSPCVLWVQLVSF